MRLYIRFLNIYLSLIGLNFIIAYLSKAVRHILGLSPFNSFFSYVCLFPNQFLAVIPIPVLVKKLLELATMSL